MKIIPLINKYQNTKSLKLFSRWTELNLKFVSRINLQAQLSWAWEKSYDLEASLTLTLKNARIHIFLGDNFCDFLFANLPTKPLRLWGLV